MTVSQQRTCPAGKCIGSSFFPGDFAWDHREGCQNVADPISRSPALHVMQAEVQAPDGNAASVHEDIDTYDSLDVSASFLQRVCNGYAADYWFSDAANTCSPLLLATGENVS